MNLRLKYGVISVGLGAIISLVTITPAFAVDPGDPTPITISGRMTDHGQPVQGYGVVAWCGNLSNFGGWDDTDVNGWYEIHTFNSTDCPLGAHGFLEVFDRESNTVYIVNVIIREHTSVDIRLDDRHPVPVPEFGWLQSVVALVTGGGVIALGRRRFAR